MRVCILGDKKGTGGNVFAAKLFADILAEKGVRVDYIGDGNIEKDSAIYPYSVKSSINSINYYNNLKTPAESLIKMSYVQKRLYEQLKTKVYDAYIINRMDFYPIIQSLKLSNKVPVWVPTHDISLFEEVISNSSFTTESPFRNVEYMKHLMNSRLGINIISSSKFIGDQIKEFNEAINIYELPIPLNNNILKAEPNAYADTEGVLWVGSQTSYKNPNLMFEIVKAMPDIKFTMVLNTSGATFTKASKKYNANNLTLLPSQNQEQLIKLYKSHRLGIVTSNVETFCIVAQEQQLFHPTLIWNKSCNKYHNIWDHAIEFGDIKDAINIINDAYKNEELFNNAISNIRNEIIKKYNIDSVKPLYFEFIKVLKNDLKSKNNFKDLNTMGAMLSNRLNIMDEYSYEDLLLDVNYADPTLAQLSMLSQLGQFDRKEYNNYTAFIKKKG